MKKIFFILLLLPVKLMAQKNYSHVDSLYKHMGTDTINFCITKYYTIPPFINEGWINIQWFNKEAAVIYPDMKDLYKWNYEWQRVFKGISIPN